MEQGSYVEMHVEEMKKLMPSSPEMLRKFELNAESTVETLTDLAATAEEQYYHALIKKIVEERYGLGTLLDVYQIFGGYVNITYGIYVEKDGVKSTWTVRKYRAGKTIDALMFEHKLLLYAREHGAQYTAAPIFNKEGKSYVIESIDMGDTKEDYLFAIFNYIDGARLYDWMTNWAVDTLKDITVETAAQSLAEFHSATCDFDPQGLRGDNLLGTNEDITVNNLVADLPRRLLEYRKFYAENGLENKFTEYMDTFQDDYTTWCKMATIPAEPYAQMFKCPCHLDFHGGNFKYWEDESVSGSFDYDMAMIDSRLFDIALGMHYSFASWSLSKPGVIDLARIEQFVKAYNARCVSIGRIPPLNEVEKAYFYEAMVQAPIYVYGWAQGSVSADLSADEYEYLFYCQHFSDSIKWLIENEQAVRELGKRL